jgi:predicted nuclease of predicted toxin-antitoxin system
MSEAIDEDILRRGVADQRIIVTLDADFHAHLALSGASSPSVIRFRIEGLKADEFVVVLKQVIERCRSDLESGAVVSVQANRIRVRRLPIA